MNNGPRTTMQPSSLSRENDLEHPDDDGKIEHSIDSGSDDAGSHSHPDLEKRERDELRREASRGSNTQAVPGLRMDRDGGILEHDEDDDGHDVENSDGENDQDGRGGLAAVIGRVLSRTTSKSSWNPGPPPDGGLKAWTAVACAHLVIMNTWGYINSFGVFQSYYTQAFDLPPSTISWIGSIQVFLLFFIGTFTGRLTDAGYFRPVFLLGSAFQLLGIFATSACTAYWQLLLAQGVCMGVGNGCLFCPAMTTVSTYFNARRGLALGVVACGSATGGLIFPAMVRQLLPSVGFAWTIRAIGFIQMIGLVICNLFLKTRIPPRKTGTIVEWAAFRELEYTFYAAGSFTSYMGVYFAFYYIASYSRDIIGMSYTDSLNLLLLLNGIGIIGRVGLNHLADRIGAVNVYAPTSFLAGMCSLAWMAVSSEAGLYVWVVFYGIVAGGIQALFPAGLSSLTTDLRKAGVRMGMVFTIVSFATLTGPPVAGAIISRSGGEYYGSQAFAGCMLLVGCGFMIAARMVRTRRLNGGWMVKV